MKARIMSIVKQANKHPKSDGDGGIKGQEKLHKKFTTVTV